MGTPVKEARRVIPEWAKQQVKKSKEIKFAKCPGMFDMAQMGYIIPAWTDIHIKANKQGVVIKCAKNVPEVRVVPMKMDVVEGLAPFRDGVARQVWKIEVPWAVFCKPGYSAQVLPATFHSSFLDKVYVYPGVVDYEGFHSINLIISVLEECEIDIWAGEPLLQVIPYKRESITASCGKADEKEVDKHRFGFFSRLPNFYRKAFHHRKSYTMSIEE